MDLSRGGLTRSPAPTAMKQWFRFDPFRFRQLHLLTSPSALPQRITSVQQRQHFGGVPNSHHFCSPRCSTLSVSPGWKSSGTTTFNLSWKFAKAGAAAFRIPQPRQMLAQCLVLLLVRETNTHGLPGKGALRHGLKSPASLV